MRHHPCRPAWHGRMGQLLCVGVRFYVGNWRGLRIGGASQCFVDGCEQLDPGAKAPRERDGKAVARHRRVSEDVAKALCEVHGWKMKEDGAACEDRATGKLLICPHPHYQQDVNMRREQKVGAGCGAAADPREGARADGGRQCWCRRCWRGRSAGSALVRHPPSPPPPPQALGLGHHHYSVSRGCGPTVPHAPRGKT